MVGDIVGRQRVAVMRAGQHGVEVRRFGGETALEFALHGGELVPAEQATSDTRLVGDDDDGEAGAIGLRDQGTGAVDQPHLLRP